MGGKIISRRIDRHSIEFAGLFEGILLELRRLSEEIGVLRMLLQVFLEDFWELEGVGDRGLPLFEQSQVLAHFLQALFETVDAHQALVLILHLQEGGIHLGLSFGPIEKDIQRLLVVDR